MLRRVVTYSFIYSLLQLTQSSWGRKLLEKQGRPMIEKKLLSYLDPESSGWRGQRMTEVARTAIDAFLPFLCDTETPRSVRRGTLNVLHAFEGVNQRQKLRELYGLKHIPAFFVLNPTDECDMGCAKCYMNSKKKGSTLPLWAMDHIVTEMKKKLGIHFVVISGGEPFQRWNDLAALADIHGDVSFMVYTNGSKITPKRVAMLARLGNIVPAISVEGFEAASDERRGRGYFKRTTELMKALREAGVLFGFSATAMRHNVDALSKDDEFIDWAIKQGCRFGWFFIYLPIGRGADPNCMVTTEQRSQLSSKVFEWLGRKPIVIGDFWNGGPLVQGCIAGKYYFAIEADGSLSTCVFMPVSMKDTIYRIFTGMSKYGSITEAICLSPTFRTAGQNAEENMDHDCPCQIIDKPELACLVWSQEDAVVNKKTPSGFFDPEGATQVFLRKNAKEWRGREKEPHLKGSLYEKRIAL